MVTRRSFLRRGLWGGLLLAAGGVGLGVWPTRVDFRPRRRLLVVDERRFAVLAAVAARTVRAPGADPVEIAHRTDETLALAPVEAQKDFRDLLGLFENALAGLVLDGRPRPFTRLAAADQDRVLEHWRDSRLLVRRSGYLALRKITQAAHYSQPSTWESVGYPGPPKVST
jgi:hypothetical protein